jgi:hypothetical protein
VNSGITLLGSLTAAVSVVGLMVAIGSFWFALQACLTHKGSSRRLTQSTKEIPKRLFLSPTETFHAFKSPTLEEEQALFVLSASQLDEDKLTSALVGQLYVDMKMQERRYGHLRRAFAFLPYAIITLLLSAGIQTVERLIAQQSVTRP